MLLGVSSLFEMHPYGSGCQIMYHGIWWHILDANRSTSTRLKACIIFWNIGSFNIHSFGEFFIYLRALSAMVFKAPGRYSAVNVI